MRNKIGFVIPPLIQYFRIKLGIFALPVYGVNVAASVNSVGGMLALSALCS